ncbi:MAG: selenide, water dikinase SelD [Chitinophagaceae bacterium]|nr:MAG: selenide, water dikinase SelD [Chitinophagaceae bacterium]
MDEDIKLTQYSRGAGCGCKIAPKALEEILRTNLPTTFDKNLLVGNSSNDDAAVYDIGNGQALISSADFFMPIVDDPFDFGRIAAANAISDIYAMGASPLMAVALLGWPVEKLSAAVAQRVLDGARTICQQAGIPLAGGHSIDSAEPIFGLSVNGLTSIEKIKKNNTANEGDWLFLTKPIGTGILSTAQKRGLIKAEHVSTMINQMSQLNKIGVTLGAIPAVSSMTDVTGFGLLGHLVEMATGAGLSAELYYQQLPVMDGAKEYLSQRIVPDATYRNWNSYSAQTGFEKGVNVMEAFNLLPDPQTNGGLLFAVKETGLQEIREVLNENGLKDFIEPIGKFVAKGEKIVMVK